MRFRVGLAQCDVALGDLEANLEIHRRWMQRAREASVDLLIFPELSLTGYLLQDLTLDVAQAADSELMQELAAEAGNMVVVVGAIELSEQHVPYITSFVLENGGVAGLHRKVYPASYGVFDEARFVGAGRRIAPVPTRVGDLGLAICEDAWHPSLVTTLLLDGAGPVVCPTASPVREMGESGVPGNVETWRRLLQTYASLFGCYVCFCNRVGTEDGFVFWGGSHVLDPEGTTVATAALYDEALVVAEIDTLRLRQARAANPVLRDERLDLTAREWMRIAGKAPLGGVE